MITSAARQSRLLCDRFDDLLAKDFERADWILSRQMDSNHAPAMRLEGLEVAEVLRLIQHREVVRSARYRNRLAMVLRDLQIESGVGSAFVQLSGRMQVAGAVTERGRDSVALDHGFANRGDLLVHSWIRRYVRHRRKIIAGSREVQEFADQSAKIAAALQRTARGAAGEKRELALLGNRRKLGQLVRAFVLREEPVGVVLAFLNIRLIEGVDADNRAGGRRGYFPAHELLADIDPIRNRDHHGGNAGLSQHLERRVLRKIAAAFELEEREHAVLAVILRVDQRLVADRNQAGAFLAGALGD